MKKIEAFIKPFRLEEIKAALLEAGIGELRFTQVQEIGKETSQENYRGTEYRVDFDARIMVMMVVEDDRVNAIATLIRKIASTENLSDGEILVMPIETMIPI
ncbi:MAG: P-II family nitrogen regulator [Leptospirales bacterium]|jgi:nitrogen regulatory protein P-II 1